MGVLFTILKNMCCGSDDVIGDIQKHNEMLELLKKDSSEYCKDCIYKKNACTGKCKYCKTEASVHIV